MLERWVVTATFQSQDQAKQAATMLVAMRPMKYEFSAERDAATVWIEQGKDYGASDVRI